MKFLQLNTVNILYDSARNAEKKGFFSKFIYLNPFKYFFGG